MKALEEGATIEVSDWPSSNVYYKIAKNRGRKLKSWLDSETGVRVVWLEDIEPAPDPAPEKGEK